MTGRDDRYDRQIRLFGAEGQSKLRKTSVALPGVGGVGSALAQHLALLGVRHIYVIEPEELDETNRNRFIGARCDDSVPGSPKAKLATRLIEEINPEVGITEVRAGLVSEEAFDDLDAPVLTLSGRDVPYPYSKSLEAAMRPTVDDILESAQRVL